MIEGFPKCTDGPHAVVIQKINQIIKKQFRQRIITNGAALDSILLTGMTGMGKSFVGSRIASMYPGSRFFSCCEIFESSKYPSELHFLNLLGLDCNFMTPNQFIARTAFPITDSNLIDSISSDKFRIIILDNIQLISSKLIFASDSLESRLCSILEAVLETQPGILIIGIVSDVTEINQNFLKHGRFGHIVNVSVSLPSQRLALLADILSEKSLNYELIKYISERTNGHSPADLIYLAQEIKDCHISSSEIDKKIALLKPALLKDLPILPQNATNLGHEAELLFGFDEIIENICFNIKSTCCGLIYQQPLSQSHGVKNSDIPEAMYVQHNTNKPFQSNFTDRGIIIYGESGMGKTSVALECARRCGINTIHVQGTMIRSSIVGESEKNLAALFARLRITSPAILLIDQIESLFGTRTTTRSTTHDSRENSVDDRLITTFLTELDGVTSRTAADRKIIILATTCSLAAVDPAILRPGRLGNHVCVPKLNEANVESLIRHKSHIMPIESMTDTQITELASKMVKLKNTALMQSVFTEAAISVIRNDPSSNQIPFEILMTTVTSLL